MSAAEARALAPPSPRALDSALEADPLCPVTTRQQSRNPLRPGQAIRKLAEPGQIGGWLA